MAGILITAGPTRQYIDSVRFISNASSGKMGYAIAWAAAAMGHDVTLISGPVSLRPPKDVKLISVVTGQQMFDAVKAELAKADCLIMAAAVTDYAPARVRRTKLKRSTRPISIRLVPMPDILRWASRHRPKGCVVVGFALEDVDPRRRAQAKLADKGLDAVVLNTPAAIGAGKVSLQVKVPDRPWIEMPYASKATQARRLVRLVEGLLACR